MEGNVKSNNGIDDIRENQKNQREDNIYPSFMCPACRVKFQLEFDPLKSPMKWHLFNCPECGWHNKDDDYLVMRRVKIELRKIEMINLDDLDEG